MILLIFIPQFIISKLLNQNTSNITYNYVIINKSNNNKYILNNNTCLHYFYENHIINQCHKIKDNTKTNTALCAIGKNENLYIKEYVSYYKKLGLNKLIIYDNNDEDGERFEEVINDEIESDFVEIVNFRNKIFSQAQKFAYTECYEIINNYYDWILFFDLDEFLYFTKVKTLNQFLYDKKFQKCNSIFINWLNYGDNGHLYYENKPVMERFTKPTFYQSSQVKSLVRGGFYISYKNMHKIIVKIICDSYGTDITNKGINDRKALEFACVKHYITKSAEEYANKMARGYFNKDSSNNITYFEKIRIDKYYFNTEVNNITLEKILIFEKKLNITLTEARRKLSELNSLNKTKANIKIRKKYINNIKRPSVINRLNGKKNIYENTKKNNNKTSFIINSLIKKENANQTIKERNIKNNKTSFIINSLKKKENENTNQSIKKRNLKNNKTSFIINSLKKKENENTNQTIKEKIKRKINYLIGKFINIL